jgi:hypothetical protein
LSFRKVGDRFARLVWSVALPVALCAQGGTGAPTFEKDVLPIFSTYCFTCHGKSSPELGLDLRTAASVLRGSHNGRVIEKGSPGDSRLLQKVSMHLMPPPAFKSTVPDADVETIRRWIEAGAQSEASDEIPEAARRQISRFENEIQPIFNANCTACHGGESPQSGLSLTSLAGLLKGGKHGPVISEGFSDKSVLIRQLSRGAMPPPGAGKALDESQVELIRTWIDEGKFTDYVQVETSLDRSFTEAEAPEITAEDRRSWAFQQPIAAKPPTVQSKDRVRTPIDSFILARLEGRELTLSPATSRETLLRRAYFDLWGLPPTPEQSAAFLADTRPDAYERLIDRLLASPNYGQRWGRFWLDAVGYVDTTGKDFQSDKVQLADGMWRYRDYVIDAFNKDKPWDRFLTEQLAGDELVDWRNAEQYTPEMIESLVATGYLRTVLDVTNEDISDRPSDRYDALFALLDKVSSSALGLTLSCARCHTHKFDPIPQRDYYRFLSLFTAAYNPSAWIQPKKRLLYTVSTSEKEEIEQHNETVDAEFEKLTEQMNEVRAPYRESLLNEKLAQVPEPVRADTQVAVGVEAKDRDEVQTYLVKKFGKLVEITDEELDATIAGDHKADLDRVKARIETWNGYRRDLHQIQALWDGDGMPPIRLLQRGSVESPGPKVSPGFITVLCKADEDCTSKPSPRRVGTTSGHRLALAEWLTSPEHPLAARVVVNRIWQHHFGTGIVATPGNFGATGSPPTHPELLDWLAVDFVKHGWKAKRLHKMIMMSGVYGQSSRRTDNPRHEQAEASDAANRLLWRSPLRRLEAEALRDSILAVADRLDTSLGGPPVGLTARPDGLQVVSETEATRRSTYLVARRTWPLTFLAVFDFPIIDTACTRRVPSATPLQSLTMMNSEFVMSNAREAARRAATLAGENAAPTKIVEETYRLLLTREPSTEEIGLALGHLDSQRQLYARANASSEEAFDKSLENLVHMIMSSNEFLYVD